MIVTSIASNDSNNGVICNEGSIYHVVESIDQTSILLPENRFLDEAVDELDVEPGCNYKIQVFANPRSSHDTEDSPSVRFFLLLSFIFSCFWLKFYYLKDLLIFFWKRWDDKSKFRCNVRNYFSIDWNSDWKSRSVSCIFRYYQFSYTRTLFNSCYLQIYL